MINSSHTYAYYALSFILVVASMPSLASDNELAELLAFLDEETVLATKNKMNADYVPGSVTVLHGDRLRAMGIQSTGEALSLAPGIHVTPGNNGQVVSIVRGVGVSLSSSNLKILLNGIPVNSAVSGSTDSVLRLPVFQIDRMEIIRGPGSALYGEFAFSGVVNIITRSGDRALHIKAGEDQYRQGDILLSGKSSTLTDFSWNLNLSRWQTDGSGRMSGVDNFYAPGFGYSPAPIYDHEQGNLLGFSLGYQGYQLAGHLVDTERGAFYGELAMNEADFDPREETVSNLMFSKQWQLTEQLATDLAISYQHIDFQLAKHMTLPEGVAPPGPPAPPLAFDQLRVGGYKTDQQRLYWGLDWQSADNNTLLLALEVSQSAVHDSYAVRTNSTTGRPVVLSCRISGKCATMLN